MEIIDHVSNDRYWVEDFIQYKESFEFSKYVRDKYVKVAFLDTGCEELPSFKNYNIKRYTILPSGDSLDTFGHGTMCAGILANYSTMNGYNFSSRRDIFLKALQHLRDLRLNCCQYAKTNKT